MTKHAAKKKVKTNLFSPYRTAKPKINKRRKDARETKQFLAVLGIITFVLIIFMYIILVKTRS